MRLSESNVLVCGLKHTSRTETIEEYLKDKAKSLTVVLLSSCFLRENFSSCRVYEAGSLKKEFALPCFQIRDYKWYRQPLIVLVLLVYFVSICYAIIRVRKRHDIYIGISYSFGLWGAVLKRLGFAKYLIYYCIDYYLPSNKIDFNTFFIKAMNVIERFTISSSDYVWDLSTRIGETREKIGKIKRDSYHGLVVPLGYSSHVRRREPFSEINRWEIGFVGSISANQGLQLLIKAMPKVIEELPQVKVTIIGEGPYSNELSRKAKEAGLEGTFNFLGFIKEEARVLDILSRCAVCVALYSETIDNKNIICADAGKPKLYAVLGLPMIVTSSCSLSEYIIRNNAGVVIEYNTEELVGALLGLLSNDEVLKKLRNNSFSLGGNYLADSIFDKAVAQMGLR